MNTQPPSAPPKGSNPAHNRDDRKRNFQAARNIKPKINGQPDKVAVTQGSSSSSSTHAAALKSFSIEAWNEIVQFVIGFHAGIDLFLALVPKLSASLSPNSKKHIGHVEQSFKDFNKNTSMLLNLFLNKGNHTPNESLFESLVDTLSKLTKVFDSIKSLSSVAIKTLNLSNDAFMAECQEKLGISLETFFPVGDPERTNLETTYDASRFTFTQTAYSFICNVAAPARLMQYFNRLEMLFTSLVKSTKGYSDNTTFLLNQIHERIKKGLEGMNESGHAKFSRQPTVSMRRTPDESDESKKLTKVKMLDLDKVLFLGIAYTLHIIAYHHRVEPKSDNVHAHVITKGFNTLLTSTVNIFLTNERSPIDVLRKELESLRSKLADCHSEASYFLSSYKELVQNCIDLLTPKVDEHSKALRILCSKLNLKDQEQLTTAAQADFYSCHAIIKWVSDEVENSPTYKKSQNTFKPVKGFTLLQAVAQSATNTTPRLICESLRLEAYAEDLKRLLECDQVQLHAEIANMKGFFKAKINYLLIHLFAKNSQYCGINLAYMKIESISSLKTLLAIIGFKEKESYSSAHEAIMAAYHHDYPSHPIYNEASKKPALLATETKDIKALCIINIMHIVSTYQTSSNTEVAAKIISLAIQWYFLHQRSNEEPANLSKANKVFLQLKLAAKDLRSDHSWLMPTLENLTNGTLVPAGKKVPENLILQKVAHEDALHYVYKCTIRQYAVFYINYLNSVNTAVSKKHSVATAKQRFADTVCKNLDSLFCLSFEELNKKISEAIKGDSKTIIGLLQSITENWEESFNFNTDQIGSIKTIGELSEIMEESNNFLTELNNVINPTQAVNAMQSTSSTSSNQSKNPLITIRYL